MKERIKCIFTQLTSFNDTAARNVLYGLLAVDLVFILIHLIQLSGLVIGNTKFDIGTDGGYPELFQYAKFGVSALILLAVSVARKSAAYVTWCIFILFLLADDALQIHEQAGDYVSSIFSFTPPFGVRVEDLGEAAACALAGSILLALVATAYWKSNSLFKKISHDLLLLIIILAFFGIVVDIAHFAVHLGRHVTLFLTTSEDGGEMVMTSLILWYTFYILRQADRPEKSICKCLIDGWQMQTKNQPNA